MTRSYDRNRVRVTGQDVAAPWPPGRIGCAAGVGAAEVLDLAFIVARPPQINPLAADPADTSSRRQRGERADRRRLSRLAVRDRDLMVQHRIFSSLTSTPRCARSSSTSRKLRLKRKHSHTAWWITSAGNRWRLSEIGFTTTHPNHGLRRPGGSVPAVLQNSPPPQVA